MGDWYGTAALILAIVLFVVGTRVWENRGAWLGSSPTPPPAAELDDAPQVNEPPTAPLDRQGRGSASEVHTSPAGVKGVMVRPSWIAPGDDDDD